LDDEIPEIKANYASILNSKDGSKKHSWFATLQKHPAIMALDVDIDAAKTGVELARQKYKPAWGINASYGYRADSDNQVNRADLLSVGVTFDLPLFTGNRQDKEVKAALANEAALESEKLLLLRKFKGAFMSEMSQLSRLQQRLELFEHSLLPQINQQAEATLSAYTNDDGDFAGVIRARISELDALIDVLNIKVNMALTQVKLNYLLVGNSSTSVNTGDY